MSEPACTAASRDSGEEPAGTAPSARAWLCLEQDGPWGARAWTQSHLDPELGGALERIATEHGVRPALIRRPGRHADSSGRTPRRVLLASTHPDRCWLDQAEIADPAVLLDLDWTALAAGDRAAVRASLPGLSSGPVQLLVCTNGTRDVCCARWGRPVAVQAAGQRPGRVWEVTHTSGHRFAPTTVLLPSGYLHAGVTDGAGLLDEAEAGRLGRSGCRGRSCWPAPGQAAEQFVREHADLTGLDELRIEPADQHWRVRHRDGRSWLVAVESEPGPARPASCGAAAEPTTRWRTALVG